MITAIVFAALFIGANAQVGAGSYSATLAASATTGWATVNYPMNTCTTDANCVYLT